MMRRYLKTCIVAMLLTVSLAGCGVLNKNEATQRTDYNAEQEDKPVKLQPLDEQKEEVTPDKNDGLGEDDANVANGEKANDLAIEVDTKDEFTSPSLEGMENNEVDEVIQEDDDRLQIVYMGDSIFDNARDGSGIPALTSKLLDAKVYNLAIAGTTAALKRDESAEYEKWTSWGLLGATYVLGGKVSPDIFNGLHTREILDTFDPQKTDVFVIEYGINDFMAGYPCNKENPDVANDPYCYYGAIQMACNSLAENFPTALVVYCAPHYVQFWNGGTFIGDCNTVNVGLGTLNDYAQGGRDAATQSGAYCFFPYDDIDIDAYNADKCLEDGIHLTAEGRELYAEGLAHFIEVSLMERSN